MTPAPGVKGEQADFGRGGRLARPYRKARTLMAGACAASLIGLSAALHFEDVVPKPRAVEADDSLLIQSLPPTATTSPTPARP